MPSRVTDDRSTTTRDRRARARDGRSPAKANRLPKTASPLFADEHPDEQSGVRRLYTVAMMADVLGAPPAAVRHWVRGGLLAAARRAGAIEWFDFPQLVIGRRLVRLLAAGFSLRDIDSKLSGLAPGGAAEAAKQSERIVTDGRRLSIRRGNRLVSAGGQLQLGFYTESLHADELEATPALLPRMESAPGPVEIEIDPADDPADEPTCVADLLDLADDLEAAGEYLEAAEALRAALQAGGPTAQVVYMLAELLYRAGDLTAARERYYAAVELDADHLEARSSLGCVLAELGEHELALAALEGVLRQQPDYADAHWHMAGVLEETGRPADAQRHLRAFLALAPESPWAALAREKLQ
jgi:tetratricopeptide (TPR) repeat protein